MVAKHSSILTFVCVAMLVYSGVSEARRGPWERSQPTEFPPPHLIDLLVCVFNSTQPTPGFDFSAEAFKELLSQFTAETFPCRRERKRGERVDDSVDSDDSDDRNYPTFPPMGTFPPNGFNGQGQGNENGSPQFPSWSRGANDDSNDRDRPTLPPMGTFSPDDFNGQGQGNGNGFTQFPNWNRGSNDDSEDSDDSSDDADSSSALRQRDSGRRNSFRRRY